MTKSHLNPDSQLWQKKCKHHSLGCNGCNPWRGLVNALYTHRHYNQQQNTKEGGFQSKKTILISSRPCNHCSFHLSKSLHTWNVACYQPNIQPHLLVMSTKILPDICWLFPTSCPSKCPSNAPKQPDVTSSMEIPSNPFLTSSNSSIVLGRYIIRHSQFTMARRHLWSIRKNFGREKLPASRMSWKLDPESQQRVDQEWAEDKWLPVRSCSYFFVILLYSRG